MAMSIALTRKHRCADQVDRLVPFHPQYLQRTDFRHIDLPNEVDILISCQHRIAQTFSDYYSVFG